MAKHIVLGVTGSIAAYKAADLVSRFRKKGFEVKVILTKNGSEFITPLTLETLSNNPVACDMWQRNAPYEVEHISLAKWADVFIIAPATANFIAKYTCGIADDMLSTTVLATKAPVFIAPAMNTAMYEHITTQNNMQILKQRGVHFIEPDSGILACGDSGKGRMKQPEEICEYICDFFKNQTLPQESAKGIRFLVTAGATIEDIDPVRFITNRSTGTMGICIANAAAARGAKVTLITGNTNISANENVHTIKVRSAHDMFVAVNENVSNADVVISAAAPADFTLQSVSDKKIKKNGDMGLTLQLVPTQDILKSIAASKGKRIHIGFAAETNDVAKNAMKKIASKNLDAIAANNVSLPGCGFGTGTNSVTLIYSDGTQETSGIMKKEHLADWLLDRIMKIYDNNKG